MKRTFLTYIATFLCAILCGSILLIVAYALPLKSIDEHVEESVAVLVQEGDYPAETPGMAETLRDNYTDALMLNMASYNNRDYSLIRKAFGNYKKRSSDKSAVNWLQRRNEKNCKSISYARYWHGYLVPLKILLEIFNYQQIRSLLIFCELLLIVWNCLLLQKRQKKQYIFPFLITLMFFPLNVVGKSLQFSTVFIPTLLETGIMMKCRKEHYGMLLFLAGIVTAYLDLLTYPLVSLGFLLCFSIILGENVSALEKIKRMIVHSILWGIGYCGMWASKWFISSLLLQENVLRNAVDTAAFRVSTSNGDNTWTYMDVLKLNVSILPKIILVPVLLFAVYLIIQCFYQKLNRGNIIRNIICNSVFLLIACMPFVWYIIMSNHSYIHAYFTHRELAISCMAVLFYLRTVCDKQYT